MNNNNVTKLRVFTVISAIITTGLGVLGHFVYDFFPGNKFVALFFPVNESTWEHIKLLYFPMILCLLISCLILRTGNCNQRNSDKSEKKICSSCFLLGTLLGSISGILAIPILFYTLTGMIGYNIDWLNIVIYMLAVIIAYFVFYQYASLPFSNTFTYHNRKNSNNNLINTKSDSHCKSVPSLLSIFGLILIAACFFVFTFYTPRIGLFFDTVTRTYGF